MGYRPVESSRLYERAEGLVDAVWDLASQWPEFARRTVGLQIVRAADSIGANIAEGSGRFHPADVCKFLYYARGSLREPKFFLRRAERRGLLTTESFQKLDADVEQVSRELNAFINFQKSR